MLSVSSIGRVGASRLDRVPTLVLVVLVALVYFGLAKLGLSFAQGSSVASAVWPPMGVALAAVLLCGFRVLPGILIGAFAANVTGESGPPDAAGIALSNTLSLAVAAGLLALKDFDPALRRVRDVILLALLGAALGAFLNATIANGILWAEGSVDPSGLWESWRVWFLGDLTGILLCTPPVLLLLMRWERMPVAIGRVAEATVGLALLTAATILILREGLTVAYPVFPLLVLIGMRYRQTGAVMSALIVSSLAIYYTARGEGPFIGGPPADELLQAQLFVAFAVLTALMVAAARTEWEQSEVMRHQLADSQKALAEAQQLANIGSWEKDLRTGEITWSDELYRIFGIDRESGEGHEVYRERTPPDELERITKVIAEATEEDRPFNVEHRIIRPDGRERYVDCHGRFVHDADGNQTKLIGTAQDLTARRDAEQQVNYLAMHDQLTGLANRTLFLGRLEQALGRGQDSGPAVLYCDLDNFKVVNDRLGHEAGDQVLAALAPRLQQAVRPEDLVARLGGDEFVVMLERFTDQAEVMNVAQRLGAALEQPVFSGGRKHGLSASIGVVFTRPGEMTASEVLRDADAAMYRSKSAGRGVISVFDDQLRADLVRRIQIENDLRLAVRRRELRLVYQPVFATGKRRPVGVEALLRWRHPEWGTLLPGEFIEIAERTGTIDALGSWVLDRACHDAASWLEDSDYPELVVSVNIAASQASDPGLPDVIQSALDSSGLPPERLALEITESALLEKGALPVENLHRLREIGVQLLLDDFGTGYSSLSYLRRLPINAIKVDREFIIDLGKREETTAIVAAILSMSRSLGLEVVAEGIESEEQLEWLRDRGCRLVQGNYLAKPLSPKKLRSWLKTTV